MPSSNPSPGTSVRPTLRERASDLKAATARVMRSRKPLPAPGSPEALAAFQAACREDTRLSVGIVDGYPELKRPPFGWWTTDCLGRALETGALSPVEVARLYPLAAERELRLSAISHRLNLGALHALAFAADYPHSSAGEDDGRGGTDLVRLGEQFTAAAAREIARAEACNAAQDRGAIPERLETAANEAYIDAEMIADRIAATPATTAAGFRVKLRALLHYAPNALARDLPEFSDPDQRLTLSLRRDLGLDVGADGKPGPDPILAAIEAHTAARAAFSETVNPADRAWVQAQGGDTSDAAMTAAEALRDAAGEAETSAWTALFEIRPTTLAGVTALVRHCQEFAADNNGLTGGPRLDDIFGVIVTGLRNVGPVERFARTSVAGLGPQDDRTWAVAQARGLDLSGVPLTGLCALFDRFSMAREQWSDSTLLPTFNTPAARGSGFREHNAAGAVVDREDERAGAIREAIMAEIERRTPADEAERDARLDALIRWELECNMSLRHAPKLRAQIAREWGA